VDRCALFVDAGYVLTDGAMAVHGTRRRESVSWDYAGLLQLFGSLATERTRLPLLRCYWYEATVEGRRSADHDTLADLPGVKLRVAKMRPGRREGVEGEIHRDLTTLARNKAVSDVMVVSAEEDLAQVIADVQDMGMRVTLLNIAADGNGTTSRALRQECDDFVEVSAAQLRPYVELISGAEPPRPDETDAGSVALRPAMNGSLNGNGVNGTNGNSATAGRPAAFAQQAQGPQGRPGTGPQPPALSGPQPVVMDAPQGDHGQPERVDAPAADFSANVDYGANIDYGAAADYAPAAEHAPAADQPGAVDYGSALEYAPAADYAPGPEYPAPAPTPMSAPVPVAMPREDIYAAPVPLPVPTDDMPGERDRDRTGARPRLAGDLAAYNPGAVREQYQRDGMLREAPSADNGDRLQPVPVALPGSGSAQVRRLPTRGAIPGAPNPGQPVPGLPPAPPDNGLGQPQLGGQPSSGQPTGGQPAVPVAPVVPMDYQGNRGALGGPRHVIQAPGAPAGPGPQVPPGAQPGPQVPPMPQAPQVPPMPQGQGGQPVPVPQPELGAPSGPIGLAGPGGYSGGAPGVSLADAVQSAHEEGQAFGESVARDAPALWLEAVLARKPRMPSDLEARLLQGSALPIDFLLHDEVRHALRRGFWDALERARR
jgi:NYN domain-containing protein